MFKLKGKTMGPVARITVWIIFGITVLLIAWDVYCTANKETGDTISEVMYKLAVDHPIIPLALGIVLGHLTWPQKL